MNSLETLLTNIMLNTFWQSLVLGLLCILMLKFMFRRSAAERALLALCCMLVLAMLPVVNWARQEFVAESQTSIPVLSQLQSRLRCLKRL